MSVEGFIEDGALYNNTAALICNEEGKLLVCRLNRIIDNDIIVGPFIIAGCEAEGSVFISLNDSQLNEYQKVLSMIEFFIKKGGLHRKTAGLLYVRVRYTPRR